MAHEEITEPTFPQPPRLWPGVVIVTLQWLLRFGLPTFMPETALIGMMAGLLGGLAVVVWWAFFSRAPRTERWGAIVVIVVAMVATPRLLHESIATGGMGTQFFMYATPVVSLALVIWAAACRRLSDGPRRATMVVAILLACGVWTLFRTGGVAGDGAADFAWRWAETPEERLLAQPDFEPTGLPAAASAPAEAAAPPAAASVPSTAPPASAPSVASARPVSEVPPAAPAAATPEAEWPGFRGPDRDGVVRGARIGTDWSRSPPVELWRRPIGPGWSSFAVRGNLLYTQEQRGEHEVVACYNRTTGEPVWRHHDATRFWESNAGAGPRATPTLSGGRVYTLGATGILNVLEATDGTLAWSRNAASDAKRKVPIWGFAGSPLVVGDVVVVAVAGKLVAYDLAGGEPRWQGPDGGYGYGSPHPLTIDGVAQVLLLSESGATSVSPSDGTLLWKQPAPGVPIVQPALTADGDVLISDVEVLATGMRRIAVARGPGGWTVEERWQSVRLKPYYNDFVVHRGHAYGFDGGILACIDVEEGRRKWKGGRYGHGQLVLSADQDLLLVLSEQGELALVGAVPDKFTEHARFPAIEGKTWNHPVVVGDVVLVRNGQEMAAFRLPRAGD